MDVENQIFVTQGVSKYKVIVIEGEHYFGYGHIFFDGEPATNGMRSGDFIFKKMDYPYDWEYSIIYCPNNEELVAYSAVEPSSVATVSHPDLNMGQPIFTTNSLSSINNELCPVGNSGGNNPGHLHLYSFENEPTIDDIFSSWDDSDPLNRFRNQKDPLELLTYPEPEYNISIEATQYLTTDENGPFCSGTLESAVKVVCQIEGELSGNRYDKAMDINNVELFYKSTLIDDGNEELQNWGQENSHYNLFKGPYFESKICVGATIGTDRYPSPGFPDNNTIIDIAHPDRQGSMNRTGINGVCYGSEPYDEFYFQDIVTRINEEDNFGHTAPDYAN